MLKNVLVIISFLLFTLGVFFILKGLIEIIKGGLKSEWIF